MDDFVQHWSNPRIKYFKIRHWNTTSRWWRFLITHWINHLHFFDPLHRFCKYNTSPYRNSRTFDNDKWLRKSVYDDKHTFNNGETIADNYVNDATHVDTHKMQTWAHLHAVCSCIAWFVHITFHMAQAARTCLPQSSHPWTCAAFLECLLFITLYLLSFLHFFLPFLMTDGDSVTINNLRDSANGTFVTLDDCLHLTACCIFGPRELLVLWSCNVAEIGWRNLFSDWTSARPADVSTRGDRWSRGGTNSRSQFVKESRGKPVDGKLCAELTDVETNPLGELSSLEMSVHAKIRTIQMVTRLSDPVKWTRDLETIFGSVGAGEQSSISFDADAIAAMPSHGKQRSSLGGVWTSSTAARDTERGHVRLSATWLREYDALKNMWQGQRQKAMASAKTKREEKARTCRRKEHQTRRTRNALSARERIVSSRQQKGKQFGHELSKLTMIDWCISSWKYHTSNDVFSRCKSVHKMATGKSDDELIQSDNKMRIGTRSGKFIVVNWTWLLDDKAWRGRQWQHSWLRGTARCEHQRSLPLTSTWALARTV